VARRRGRPDAHEAHEPPGAAELRTILTERGLSVAPDDLRCLASAMKGPLADGALDEARAVARSFAARL
jgi:hypothetical protein